MSRHDLLIEQWLREREEAAMTSVPTARGTWHGPIFLGLLLGLLCLACLCVFVRQRMEQTRHIYWPSASRHRGPAPA